METVTLGRLFKDKIELYDNIESLPIDLFSKFNKYLMIESALGTSLYDLDKNHLAALYKIAGDKSKTIAQLNNLRQLIQLIISEVTVNQLAFACLVRSINGKEITDYSEDSLKQIVQKLARMGLTQEVLKKKRTEQKKSYLQSLVSFSLMLLTKARKRITTKKSKNSKRPN